MAEPTGSGTPVPWCPICDDFWAWCPHTAEEAKSGVSDTPPYPDPPTDEPE